MSEVCAGAVTGVRQQRIDNRESVLGLHELRNSKLPSISHNIAGNTSSTLGSDCSVGRTAGGGGRTGRQSCGAVPVNLLTPPASTRALVVTVCWQSSLTRSVLRSRSVRPRMWRGHSEHRAFSSRLVQASIRKSPHIVNPCVFVLCVCSISLVCRTLAHN